MPLQSPVSSAGFATNMANTSENISHYSHIMEIVNEGNWQQSTERKKERPRKRRGDVFVRERERYNREHLQATAPALGRLLIDAVQNPDDPLSQEAVQALGSFAQAVEKRKGISINSAAQEFNVPESFFWRWSKKRRLIPIFSEGKGQGSPTYLDREKTQEVAEVYHEAKRQRKQPKKLLESKYPEIAKSPQK
jgi:hypothetical protein